MKTDSQTSLVENILNPAIDLNCDMGEGVGNDETIMPFISSANIACGYHAGDETTIRDTIMLAKKQGVAIGAHVSFYDRSNFGRKEIGIKPTEVYELVNKQLTSFTKISDALGTTVNHVKPHGALYNMAARDAEIARAIAHSIKDFNPRLLLFGLSGSHSIAEGERAGLKTVSEVFADRTYQDDGSLTPRSERNALIETLAEAIDQVLLMVRTQTVLSVFGKEISIKAESICIHGDGKDAPVIAEAIYNRLKKENIIVDAPHL